MPLGSIGFAVILIVIPTVIIWLSRKPPGERMQEEQGAMMMRNAFGMLDPMAYDVFSHVPIPAESSAEQPRKIDYIVLSRSSIFVIDSNNFHGALFGHTEEPYWTQVMCLQRRRVESPTWVNAAHIQLLQKEFPDIPQAVWVPIVAVPDMLELHLDESDSRDIVPISQLAHILRHTEGSTLSAIQRDAVMKKLIYWKRHSSGRNRSVFPHWEKQTSTNHAQIAQGRCPLCSSPLEVTRNSGGPVTRCSHYPSCLFSTKVLSMAAARQARSSGVPPDPRG
jgi:hypothetical protein